jgi:L-threonylcarbamoyladenylate synthase
MFKEEIEKTVTVLRDGGVILYPTDTIWGIGCDATNAKAVEKIFAIKKRPESQSMIILLHDVDMIKDFASDVPEIAYDLINNTRQPFTIIYKKAKNLAPKVIAADGTIAIRVVEKPFVAQLIEAFGKPIVSTSANISGRPAPIVFKNISESIIKEVDYIVDYYRDIIEGTQPSMIIRLNDNNDFTILRD